MNVILQDFVKLTIHSQKLLKILLSRMQEID